MPHRQAPVRRVRNSHKKEARKRVVPLSVGKPKKFRRGVRDPGSKAVNKVLRENSALDRSSSRGDFASASLASVQSGYGETTEDIAVPINPYLLYQYVAGFVRSTLAASDRNQDITYAEQMAFYYFRNILQIETVTVSTWPRALLELGYSLRPRRCGRYNYSVDDTLVNGWVQALSTTANLAVAQNIGFDSIQFVAPQTAPAGFCTASSPFISTPGEQPITRWQYSHATQLDLVNVIEGASLDKGDASAFAFDVGGPQNYQGVAGFQQVAVFAQCGYDTTTSTAYYISATSAAGLETPISRPHLAKLRLGTLMGGNNTTMFAYTGPTINRIPIRTVPVVSLPGTLGYAHATKLVGSDPQMKPVPAFNMVQAIIDRINQIATLVSTSIWGLAGGGFAFSDIVVFSYSIYKHMLRKYSGAEVGCQFGKTGSAANLPDYYGLHSNDSVFESVRIPENIMKLLGSQLAYIDNLGALIPLAALFDITTVSNTAGVTYSGTSSYGTFPVGAYSNYSQRALTQNSNIAVKWKNMERYMAQYTNMRYLSQYGPSFLDATFLLDISAAKYSGLASRRRITDLYLAQCFNLSSCISYTNTQAQLGLANNGGGGDQLAYYDHQFKQRCRRDLSGWDVVSDVNKINALDGLVSAGISTSNFSSNTGPDNVDPNARSRPSAAYESNPGSGVSSDDVGLLTKLRNHMVPTHGNYCGPGWTAGERHGNPEMKDGKYLVPAVDALDEECQLHDEAYKHAKGDTEKLRNADLEFARRLAALEVHGGLSPYGHAAKHYFGQRPSMGGRDE